MSFGSTVNGSPQSNQSVDATSEYNAMDRIARRSVLGRLAKKRQKRAMVTLWAIATDALCIIVAFVAASLIRLGNLDVDQVSRILITVLPIYFGFALNNQAHQVVALLDGFRSSWRASSAFLFAATSVLLIAFFMKIGAEFSRLLFGLGTSLTVALIIGWRSLLARIAGHYLGYSPFADLCIYDDVQRTQLSGEGSIDAYEFGLSPDPNNPVTVDYLGRMARNMDSVVIHCPPEKRTEWAFLLKSLDIQSEVVTPELTQLGPLDIRKRSGQTSLVISSGPMAWNQRLLKRGFDLAVTIAILPILLPLLALIALAVKMDSPGPILFKQERIGLGNRRFKILKFRSMRVENSDASGDRSTGRQDDRVTRVGDLLRRASLDELPQFLNVLIGDMSVVGPRPHAIGSRAEDALFWDIDSRYWHRHAVKPGLTGLAQIRGFRGATEIKSDLSNRLQSDLEYIAEWSLVTDIRIVLRTFAVLFHRNAF